MVSSVIIFNSLRVILLVLILFTCSKTATSTGLGKCPRYSSLPHFNTTRFAGQWFEVERSFYLMEIAASCTSLNFTLNVKGSLDVVAHSTNRWTNSPTIKSGVAIPIIDKSSVLRFKFKTQLPFSIARMLPGAGIYHVLYTDYDHVAIIWSCTTLALVYTDKIWILGRSRDIPATKRVELYNKIRRYNLDPERLIISKNWNCVYN